MQVAFKFYCHNDAYRIERRLHDSAAQHPQHAATLLAFEDNASGEWRAPNGYVLPPFAVLERSDGLDAFTGGASSDMSAGMPVRASGSVTRVPFGKKRCARPGVKLTVGCRHCTRSTSVDDTRDRRQGVGWPRRPHCSSQALRETILAVPAAV